MQQYSTLILPLKPSQAERDELEKRFNAGFQIYRATMHHALKQLKLLRESKAWRKALAVPKGPERTRELRRLRKDFGLAEYPLSQYATKLRKGAPHLERFCSSAESNTLGFKVNAAINKHMFEKGGMPKVPRLEEFTSLEGVRIRGPQIRGHYDAGPRPKGAPVEIQLRNDSRTFKKVPLYLQWMTTIDRSTRLTVDLKVKRNGAEGERQRYYLTQLDKCYSVKVVRVWIKGRWRYEAHINFEIPPYRKESKPRNTNRVGLDLGVRSLAVVAANEAGVTAAELFAETTLDRKKEAKAKREKRRLQRAQERSRRENNPHAYNGKARIRSEKITHVSKAYKERRNVIREAARRRQAQAVSREQMIAKRVIEHGIHVTTEKVDVREWSRHYGKGIHYFAPGRLLDTVEKEALLAGGSYRAVSVWTSALSSTCICGAKNKKPITERKHTCKQCGLGENEKIHRDLFSAFLCLNIKNDEDVLDVTQASDAWAGAERLLAAAASKPVGKLTGNLTREPFEAEPASLQNSQQFFYLQDDVTERRGLEDEIRKAGENHLQ